MRLFSRSICSAAASLLALGAAYADRFEFGPLAHEFGVTLEPGTRSEFLGPLYYRQTGEDSLLWSFPPFYTSYSDSVLEQSEYEILYPLISSRRFGTEHRWQLMQIFSFGGASTVDAEVKSRANLWPFFFYQKSTEPTNSYFWLMPFYGHVKNHLFRDEVKVVGFPGYTWSRKGAVETQTYLFPFLHFRHGGGVDGWQLIPIAGHETKSPSTVTNVADEVEIVPGYNKWFTLWPLFFSEDNNLGTTNVERLRISLPFYSIQRSPARDNTTIFWPFFTHTEDRENGFSEWGFPYPFIGWARGPGKNANRLWPLWGKVTNSTQQSDFVFWPLYTHQHLHTPEIDKERTRSLFFFYSDSKLSSPESGDHRRRIDLWPLFTWQRKLDGSTRLQCLAPLEPLVPNNKSIERSWAPVYSIYREEENPKTHTHSNSLVWNLWRRDVTPKERRSSLLFGLVRTRKDATGRHWRFFWGKFPPAVADSPLTTPPKGPARTQP